jgi:hypothetical protein
MANIGGATGAVRRAGCKAYRTGSASSANETHDTSRERKINKRAATRTSPERERPAEDANAIASAAAGVDLYPSTPR